MTRNVRVLLAAAAAAALLAIPASAAAQTRTLTINLAPASSRDDPRGGAAGTAVLTDIGGGRTQVVLRVAQPTSPNMPAHVHAGRCPDVGAVIYPLNNLMNGTSTSEINVTIDQLLAGTFAINLHRSTTEASVWVSCGNVVATALPATGGAAGNLAPYLAGAGAALAGLTGLFIRRRRWQ